MSRIKHPHSRWNRANRFPTGDVMGSWNRNLQERDRAPSEQVYLASLIEHWPFKHGARIRGQR